MQGNYYLFVGSSVSTERYLGDWSDHPLTLEACRIHVPTCTTHKDLRAPSRPLETRRTFDHFWG